MSSNGSRNITMHCYQCRSKAGLRGPEMKPQIVKSMGSFFKRFLKRCPTWSGLDYDMFNIYHSTIIDLEEEISFKANSF